MYNGLHYNGLHYLRGEIDVGKTKTSINIDEEIWSDFRILVLQKEGGRKTTNVIETLIKQYIKKNKDGVHK